MPDRTRQGTSDDLGKHQTRHQRLGTRHQRPDDHAERVERGRTTQSAGWAALRLDLREPPGARGSASRLVSDAPPSSGGMGMRLSSMKTRFTSTPARHAETSRCHAETRPRAESLARQQRGASLRDASAQHSAMHQIRARSGGRHPQHVLALGIAQTPKLTGTGLAQPNRNAAETQQERSGTRIVPTGSICCSGLRLMRPPELRGHVAEVPRHVAVRRLVQRDREQHRDARKRDV